MSKQGLYQLIAPSCQYYADFAGLRSNRGYEELGTSFFLGSAFEGRWAVLFLVLCSSRMSVYSSLLSWLRLANFYSSKDLIPGLSVDSPTCKPDYNVPVVKGRWAILLLSCHCFCISSSTFVLYGARFPQCLYRSAGLSVPYTTVLIISLEFRRMENLINRLHRCVRIIHWDHTHRDHLWNKLSPELPQVSDPSYELTKTSYLAISPKVSHSKRKTLLLHKS